MELSEKVNLYKEVMEALGYDHQMHKAVEEMAELTDALMKHADGRATKEQIITEIADVIICCEQLALHFGLIDVLAERDRKMQRLTERLKEYKDKKTPDDNAVPKDSPS